MTGILHVLGRALLIAALVLIATPPAAAAQTTTPASSAPEASQNVVPGSPAFAQLVDGKRVRVTMSDGTLRRGVVVSISPTGMTLGGGVGTSVPFDRVVKVEEAPRRARRGALIGLGSGTAHGMLFFLICRAEERASSCAPYVPFWAAVGTGTGLMVAGIVRLFSRNEDVLYDATRRTTSMTIAPILSPSRKGVALSFTWR